MSEVSAPPYYSMSGMPSMRSSHYDTPQKKDIMPLPTLPSLSTMPKRKRSPSKSSPMKPNKVVKKSSSTPSVRAVVDESASSDGDKKRNKLGYHRTSVACGHCRRRKIRCMMPDDDPTGRCSNCIRLKKECIFCPVDQSIPGKVGQSANRAVSAPKAVRSTSPTPMYLQSTYGNDGFSMSYPGHSSYSVPPPDTGLAIYGASSASFSEPSVAFSHPHPYDMTSATSWEQSPYGSLPPLSAPQTYDSPLAISPVSQPYARPPSSSLRPSPFPDSAYGSASTAGGKTPTSANNEIGWAPHSAAASNRYSLTVDGLGSTRNSHSPQPGSVDPLDDGRRSASVPQPPSLIMTGDNSSTASLSESTSIGPMSATIGSSLWNNPWTPLPGAAEFEKPAAEPLDAWFTDPINGY